jgi:hypothetical protein
MPRQEEDGFKNQKSGFWGTRERRYVNGNLSACIIIKEQRREETETEKFYFSIFLALCCVERASLWQEALFLVVASQNGNRIIITYNIFVKAKIVKTPRSLSLLLYQ